MSDPVQDMTNALASALHDQLRAQGVKIGVHQVAAAVNTAMDTVGYAQLVATITAADGLTSAVNSDYPAPLARTAAALGTYGGAKSGLPGGGDAEIP